MKRFLIKSIYTKIKMTGYFQMEKKYKRLMQVAIKIKMIRWFQTERKQVYTSCDKDGWMFPEWKGKTEGLHKL